MEVDKFPADAIADLDNVIAKVDGQTAPRPPLTKASLGWEMPNRAAPPSTPASGAHLYASGGDLVVKKSNGTTFTISPAPTVPQGTAVANPPLFTSPSAPASVTVAVYQALRDDTQAGLRATLIALLDSLRNAGIIAP